MAHTNFAGAGSYLQMGSPLVTIDGVLELGGLVGGAKPVIDATPINGTRAVSVVGIPGPVTQALKLAWDSDNTQHAALWASSGGNQAAVPFSEVFSNGAIVAYSAFVTKAELVPNKTGVLEMNCELAISTILALTP